MVKSLPAMRETQVRSLSWEDPLEKGTATHSSILAWRMLWTEEPGGLRSTGSQRATNTFTLSPTSPFIMKITSNDGWMEKDRVSVKCLTQVATVNVIAVC